MSIKSRLKKARLDYHLMLFPGMIFVFIFSIVPMFGIVIAFQNYDPMMGILHSQWVGLDNFRYMLSLPDSMQIFKNTFIIAVFKIILGLIVPLIFALMLNEVSKKWFTRTVQTIVYLPHFLSWVIMASIVMNLFQFDGMINQILKSLGIKPIMFLTSNFWFRPILVGTDVWKEFGFNTIIFLAALTAINPNLFESAAIDGANRFKQIINITLPGISSTIILLATLSLGNVLNAGFEQILNLYNPVVYKTVDIIDTYVYRAGLLEAQFGLSTATGLLKSVISFVLIIVAYRLAYKHADYKIF